MISLNSLNREEIRILIIDLVPFTTDVNDFRTSDSMIFILNCGGDMRLLKIPKKNCDTEVQILNDMRANGISTPIVYQKLVLPLQQGPVESYIMEFLSDVIPTEQLDDASYRRVIPNILPSLLDKLRSTRVFNGFGSVVNGIGVYRTEEDFVISILNRIKERRFDISGIEDKVNDYVRRMKFSTSFSGVLAHNDLYKNILVNSGFDGFYVIDPQTSVSSAPRIWDLCQYKIYESVYRRWSLDPIYRESIENDDYVAFCTFLISLERASYFISYDKPKYKLFEDISKFAFKHI